MTLTVTWTVTCAELFKGALHYRCAADGFVQSDVPWLDPALVPPISAGADPVSPISSRQLSAVSSPPVNATLPGVASRRRTDGFSSIGDPGGPFASVQQPGCVGQACFDTRQLCRLGSAVDTCPAGSRCAYFDDNPDVGLLHFDSIPAAFIVSTEPGRGVLCVC